MDRDEYEQALYRCGGSLQTLATRERWDLFQCWRKVYTARLYAATGRWKLGRYDWHVFSYGYARALHGARALAEYSAKSPAVFLVCPEEEGLPALRVLGGAVPDFSNELGDVHVWPEDVNWTMAFTHHEHLGPYFCRQDWILKDSGR